MIELMSAETGVDEVIECIIQAAYRLLEVDRISLYIVDELRAQLVCKVSKDANAIGQRLPLKWGLIGRVAQEGKSINISDAANDPRFDRTLDKVTGYQTRNILTLPIQDNKNRVAAVIQISNKKKGNFSREDETLMMSLSRSAGQILRKAQLFSALLTEQRKTKALMDILRAEEGEPSIESLCDRIMQTTHDVLPCQRVALCFVDAVREDLYALVAEPLGKSDATAAAATGAATPVPAAAAASQPPNHESANTSPIAAAPSHSHVVGTPVGGGAILFSPRSGSEEQLYSARGSPARDLSGNASLSNSASSSSLAKPKRTGTKGGHMPALPSSDSKQTALSGSGNSSFGGPSPGARARRKTLSEMPTRKPFTAPLALPKPHASSPAAGSPPVAPAPAPTPSGSSLSSPPSSSSVGSKHTRGAGSSGGVALPTIPSSPSPAALPASSSMIAQDYTYVPTPLPSPVNAPLGGTGGSTELSAVAGQGTVSRLMPTPSSTRSSRSVSPRPRLSINPSMDRWKCSCTSEVSDISAVLMTR